MNNCTQCLCQDSFWNNRQFQNPNYPILTNCFQYTLLIIGPLIFFITFSIFLIDKLFNKKPLKLLTFHSFDLWHSLKIILPISGGIFVIIEMIIYSLFTTNNDAMLFISYGFLSVSLLTVSFAVELRRHGNKSIDVVLFAFWWMSFFGYLFRYYSYIIILIQDSKTDRIILFLFSSFAIITFIVSMILDTFRRFPPNLKETKHPEILASIFSQLTYKWMDRFIYNWYKIDMTDKTSFDLNSTEKCSFNLEMSAKYFREYLKYFYNEKAKKQITSPMAIDEEDYFIDTEEGKSTTSEFSGQILMKSIFRTHFHIILIACLLRIVRDILILTLPLVLKLLLNYFKEKHENYTWKGILYAFVFLLQGLFGSVFENYCFTLTNKISIRVRGSVIGLISRKTLRLSAEARAIYSAGDIANMTIVDMEQITNWIVYSWILLSCPFQIVFTLILLYYELGNSIFVGVAMIVTVIPVKIIIMRFTRKYSEKELKWKDKRMNILTEILNGIKVIKMYVWEKSFFNKIESVRQEELKNLKFFSIGWCILSVMFDLVPFLVMYSTFAFYIYFVPFSIISAEKIFVAIVLFNNIQLPMLLLPWGVTQTITAVVSFSRIEKFLLSNEMNPRSSVLLTDAQMSPDVSIEVLNGSFSWTEDGHPVLDNINLIVEKQKLIAIVGRVGVGKSSLLSAILGEMYTIGGAIQTQGKMAYVPQEAWIQNNTLKNNILCTKSCNEIFYNKVLEACCLGYDIEALPNRDQTVIGERGVNLSGGQKQRVNLARAVYQDCDIYLLDDPLSAVDVNVGQTLFSKLISNQGLLKSKTRILVTHGLKWLPFVDEICVINDQGEISERGSYEYLMNCGTEFKLFVNESPDKVDKNQNAIIEPSGLDKRKRSRRATSGSQGFEGDANASENNEKYFNDISNEEEIMSGRVSLRSIFWYFKSAGICVIASSIFACIAFGVLQAFGNVWLGRLSDTQSKLNISVLDQARDNAKYYINTYGIIGLGQLVAVIFFWGGFTVGSLRASKKIHSVLLDNVLKATLQFCDATPSGRILNRFTKDLFIIDHILNINITDIINRTVLLITSLVVISIVTPWFGIIGIPILVSYILLQVFYISSSRQARRLDSKASSFVLTHLMETYSGCSIIRSLEAESDFESIQYRHIDKSNKFKLIQYLSLRWLCLRLDILGNLIVFASVIFAVLNRFSLSGSLVGLSISYALQVTGILNWLTRQCAEFETNAVSIERIRQYTMIPVESINDSNEYLSENWISNGNINFENFSLQYNIKLPCVLKNITVSMNGGEKIGVVGRTGAGKSSLALALFRLVEGCSGKIFIDGVNINSIGLHQLRKQLTILPQDPVIFSGTLKQNLDPFDEYTDDKLLNSLEISEMLDWVNSLTEGMNYDCGYMGTNLSTGQKQLVCLARTILNKSKIIILDEATASVDEDTDRKVFDAITSQFKKSTVLIIAHRIKTIIGCDKILYLENGSIVEYGSPQDLLLLTNGKFRSLVESECVNFQYK